MEVAFHSGIVRKREPICWFCLETLENKVQEELKDDEFIAKSNWFRCYLCRQIIFGKYMIDKECRLCHRRIPWMGATGPAHQRVMDAMSTSRTLPVIDQQRSSGDDILTRVP